MWPHRYIASSHNHLTAALGSLVSRHSHRILSLSYGQVLETVQHSPFGSRGPGHGPSNCPVSLKNSPKFMTIPDPAIVFTIPIEQITPIMLPITNLSAPLRGES